MDFDASLAGDGDRPGNRARTLQDSHHQGWVMLDCFLRYSRDASSSNVALAYEHTSTGARVGVGLVPSRPPSTSCLLFDWRPPRRERSRATGSSSEDGSSRPDGSGATAVAAHRNAVLLRFLIATGTGLFREVHEEFFVYGYKAASPLPSLTRLPPCRHRSEMINRHARNSAGILCREDDDGAFVVAHLTVNPNASRPVTADLCYIRGNHNGSLNGPWRTARNLPIRDAEDAGELLSWWETDAVVPFGDHHICWVDYLRGILLCDVFSESPELCYVALPVDPYDGRDEPETRGRADVAAYRRVCVTKEKDGGGAAIRFVDVADTACWFYGRPRRGKTSSPYDAVTSWRLAGDRRSWVADGTVDCEEYLAFTKHHNLPCTQPFFPLVDMEDPQTIYGAADVHPCTYLVVANMLNKTMAKVPCTYGSAEPSGEGDRHKGKRPQNIDYCEPFITCELSRFEPSCEGDSCSGKASVKP